MTILSFAGVIEIFNTPGFIIAIGSIALGIFVKTIIGVFRLGATFKTELVTKKEQRGFEEEIRNDLKGYKIEIQKSIMDACLKIIERELKSVENLKDVEARMEGIRTAIEIQIKDMLAKYEDIKEVSDSIHSLALKVQRIEYGNETGKNRRTEK